MGKKARAGLAKGPKADDPSAVLAVQPDSSKRAQPADGANAEHDAPQPSKKAKLDEIDLIFSKKPAKQSGDSAAQSQAGPSDAKQQSAQPQQPGKKKKAKQGTAQQQGGSSAAAVVGNKDDIFGEDVGKGRKRTEEGFAIYSENELGLNKKGGDTDLCPFDCDCCF